MKPTLIFPRFLFPAFALILGGPGFAEAQPAWSLGLSLGGGSYNCWRQPEPWANDPPLNFSVIRAGLEAEMAWRGPYSLGIRAIVGADENSKFMPRDFYRSLGSVIVFVKRSALTWGPLDLSGLAGVGYEDILFRYDDGHEPWEPSHPDLPADEHFHSPVLALGSSQRAFLYVAGVTVNETVTMSFHSVAMHLDFLISLGWRKK